MAETSELFNGWRNRQTWNVALWISNDEGLYNLARQCFTWAEVYELLRASGITETPDHVAYNDSGLDVEALDAFIREMGT